MRDSLHRFALPLALSERTLASGLRACVVAALLLGVLPVVLPLGLLGSWIAVPLLVGLTATRVAIAVTAQLTSARWGVASDCEISAASRTTWLDVGFALSVGAVVDALWKHELAPGAALCIVATISFAISPPGGGALRAFSAALLAVGCIWRWQELGERQALILYEPLWLLLTAVGLVVHIAASAVRTPAAGGSLLELPGGVQQWSMLGWIALVAFIVVALSRLDAPLAFAFDAAMVWLLLLVGLELLIVLPWRIERAMSGERANDASVRDRRLPSERMALAFALLVTWLQLGDGAGTWTQLFATSSALLCAPSASSWVLGGHLVRVWGVVLALAATALAATVESVPSQGWLYLYLLILAVAWLASASRPRDIAVRGAG